jgi:hypothetical protein
VDRALLCYSAEQTRNGPENGVVSVTAKQVRAEPLQQNDAKGRPIPDRIFVADVHPDPSPPEDPENAAHCLLKLNPRPDQTQQKVFRRFIERLARLASVELEPARIDY